MDFLVEKYFQRRSHQQVTTASRDVEIANRSLIRALSQSAKHWHPREEDKPQFFARALLVRCLTYSRACLRLARSNRGAFVPCALDVARTALENTIVLVIVAKERQEGMDFIFDWANRTESKKLKEMTASEYADEEDKLHFTKGLERTIELVGKEKFGRGTVQELLDRSELGDVVEMIFDLLNPYSHFDFGKTFESTAKFMKNIVPEMISTPAEQMCFARYCALTVLAYAGVARRDLGDVSLEPILGKAMEILERCGKIALGAR